MYKKQLMFVMAIILMALSLAGCGGNDQNKVSSPTPSESESKSNSEGNKTEGELVIYGPNRVLPPDNMTELFLEEQLGMKLRFITVTAEYDTKLNLLISSGDIPDIIVDVGLASRNRNISQGLYMDLEELLNKYGDNIKAARSEEIFDQLRWTDGKLYTVNGVNNTGYAMLMIRKNWLDKLGLDVPKTLDEFTDVLKAFKQNNLNGTGEVIPFGGYNGLINFDFVFAAYGADPFHWIIKDNKVVQGAVQPELKEAIKYLRNLYKEDLMDKEYLTNDRTKATEKAGTEIWGAWVDQLWYVNDTFSAYHQNPETKLINMVPPKGPDGLNGYLAVSPPFGNFFTGISATSKYPEMAMKYLNLIADPDINLRIRAGVEGEHYSLEKGHYEVLGDYLKDNNLLIQQGITATMGMPFLPFDPPYIMYPREHDEDHPVKLQYNRFAAFYEPVQKIVDGQIGMGWEDVRDEALNKMIMEDGDIDAEFDKMVKTIYDKYRMEEQEKLANEYYDMMYRK